MPEVDAVETICAASALPTPGASRLPSETLAGASIAWAGTLVPSGSAGSWRSPAEARGAFTPARLAVQAADSRASGTSAVALYRRPNRLADIDGLSPLGHSSRPSSATLSTQTNRVTHKLRRKWPFEGSVRVTRVTARPNTSRFDGRSNEPVPGPAALLPTASVRRVGDPRRE